MSGHTGTYDEAIRIRHSDLTIQAAPGEQPHIACPVSIDANAPILCVEIDAETTGVTLRGLEVSGGFYAVYLGSQWDYDDTPLDNLTARNVLIEDCRLHDTGRDVIKIPAGCDDITVRRCEIFNSGMGYPPETPQDEKNAEGIDAVNADRVHVVDSYIHDTATTCLYVKGGSHDTVIERTRVERCGDLGIVLGFDTTPEFFDLQANPEYYENIRGVVRNCVIADTGLAGLGLYATRDAHLLHNTILRAGTRGQAGHELRFEGHVVCGHTCALAAQDEATALATLDAVAQSPITLVTLPITNLLLQDATTGRTPRQRCLTLVKEARAGDIPVLVASDNVQDPFCPVGSFDPLEALATGVLAAQLDAPFDQWSESLCRADWLRTRRTGTTALPLQPGTVADLLVFTQADHWGFPSRAQSRVVLRQGRVASGHAPAAWHVPTTQSARSLA